MRTGFSVLSHLGGVTLSIVFLAQFPVVKANTGNEAYVQNGAVFQQKETKVKGTVVDAATGEPLIGVNVSVKGTTQGVMSDFDGNYVLQLSGNNATLVFSYIGYQKQELKVPANGTLNVKLSEDAMKLDEVVVVGYGVQKKSLVTGAISSLKGQDLEKSGIMRADDALQGKTAGVQVIANSGQPGTTMSIRIRGVNTNGTAQPIYIVDGMQVSDIEYLNPSDIESIEVFKDAAACAIYGAQGGNGVVMITTKKGSAGSTEVNASYSYGIQNLPRKINVLNAKEYCVIQNEAAANGGQPLPFTDEQISRYKKGTDWQEAVLNRNAPVYQAQVSISGGDDISSFLSSVSYYNQDGILAKGKSNFERLTVSLNTSRKFFSKHLEIGENVALSRVKRQSISQNSLTAGPLVGALNMDPLTPVYDETNTDELYYGFGTSKYVSQEVVNPVARIFFSHGRSNYTKLIAGVYADLNFLKDFHFRTSVNTDRTWNVSYGYTPIYRLNSTTGNTTANGASQSMENSWKMVYDNVLSWGHNYDGHDVSAILGTSYSQYDATFMSGNRNDLIIDDPEYAWLSMATAATAGVSGGMRNPWSLLSYFGRANYTYQDKYMFAFTLRVDGSSRFGSNNRYGKFPSVSVGWNISNEDFMKQYDWLDQLKLRASWGQNGNDNIGEFRYLATISTYGLGYAYGSHLDGQAVQVGAAPTKVVNPNLKWETIEQINIGIDGAFLNCMNASFDYYRKNTKDLLLTSPTPLFLGNTFPTMNAGSVKNEGVEFSVGFKRKLGQVMVDANANMSYNKNEVTYVGTYTGFVEGSKVQGLSGAVTRMEKGKPMAYFWGFKTLGIFQNQDEVNQYIYTNEDGIKQLIQPDAKPGDFRFQDTNGDGIIDDNDRVNLGNPYPDFIYGFNLNLAYKGFDLTVNTSGASGNKVFSTLRRMDLPMSNYPSWVLGRWHGEGTSNTIPRVTTNDINQSWTRPSDFHLKDGSYFKIRNITLGYSTDLLKQYYIKKIRAFVAVSNLFTFTKYDGYNPEIGGGVMSTGIDAGVYPHSRTFTMGVNLTF